MTELMLQNEQKDLFRGLISEIIAIVGRDIPTSVQRLTRLAQNEDYASQDTVVQRWFLLAELVSEFDMPESVFRLYDSYADRSAKLHPDIHAQADPRHCD